MSLRRTPDVRRRIRRARYLTTCQPFFRVLDMGALEWMNEYHPDPPAYVMPTIIYAAVSGGKVEGARVVEPVLKQGGNWTRLRKVFECTPWGVNAYFSFTSTHNRGKPKSTATAATPSSSPTGGKVEPPGDTSPSLSGAELAGIAVGSTVAGIFLVFLVAGTLWTKRQASKVKHDKAEVHVHSIGDQPGESHGHGVVQ